MNSCLVLTIRFHDGRYHGAPDWPPSPARLFQALVAAGARGRILSSANSQALQWLEQLPPPEIRAPRARKGQRVLNYVPNNDFDSVGGDVARVAEIRTAKYSEPFLFNPEVPIFYSWTFETSPESEMYTTTILELARNVYQLGRGVDMAWAQGEVLSPDACEGHLASHNGLAYLPSSGLSDLLLACPIRGSLQSLVDRFAATTKRFSRAEDGQVLLTQAPKPRLGSAAYNCGPARQLFELRENRADQMFAPFPLREAGPLVARLRDAAASRLAQALPALTNMIDRSLTGRASRTNRDKAGRVKILALPSVGHPHVDPSIRRVLVEVPPASPLPSGDVFWAFSGLDIVRTMNVEAGPNVTNLLQSDDNEILRHYGVGSVHQCWQTITPVVLPERAARRRIEPSRFLDQAKPGSERAREEAVASTAVLQALRQAGVAAKVARVRVQREPFHRRGARVEGFAVGTRFAKERLWHVEIEFEQPVSGPLAIGDGRFSGLGLMTPARVPEGLLAFSIVEGLQPRARAAELANALRRAMMARVQEELGRRQVLPLFFSGHEPAGGRSEDNHSHLAFVADLSRNRLVIVSPHLLMARSPSWEERRNWTTLCSAMLGLDELRAGEAGRLKLVPTPVRSESDPLFAPSQVWQSLTSYSPTRHCKGGLDLEEFVAADLRSELRRRRMPMPEVEVLDVHEGPRKGLRARLRLRFEAAVSGPLLLGRSCHSGGGVFSGGA